MRIERIIVMQEARIGSKATLNSALRELEAWGLLSYHPTRNSYKGTRIRMVGLGGKDSPEVSHHAATGKSTTGPTYAEQHSPEVGQPVNPQVSYPSVSDRPEMVHHSLLDKTSTTKPVQVNGTVDAARKKNERGIDNELSKNPLKKASGIHSSRIRAAAAQSSNTSPNQEKAKAPALDVPFSQSEVAVLSAFCAAFVGTDYELADLAFYHELVGSWRDKITGEAPRRKDWVATSKRFMLNDARDNRLKLAPGVQHSAGASNSQIPPTGYRSSRFD